METVNELGTIIQTGKVDIMKHLLLWWGVVLQKDIADRDDVEEGV